MWDVMFYLKKTSNRIVPAHPFQTIEGMIMTSIFIFESSEASMQFFEPFKARNGPPFDTPCETPLLIHRLAVFWIHRLALCDLGQEFDLDLLIHLGSASPHVMTCRHVASSRSLCLSRSRCRQNWVLRNAVGPLATATVESGGTWTFLLSNTFEKKT